MNPGQLKNFIGFSSETNTRIRNIITFKAGKYPHPEQSIVQLFEKAGISSDSGIHIL